MLSMNAIAPPVSEDHLYENPAKLIKTVDDMKIWQKSEAYFEYFGFILAINESIKGKSNSRGSEQCSDAVLRIVTLLDKLDQRIDETPPIQQPQRFGNIAFRAWYQKLRDDSLILLQEVLPGNLYKAIPEIVTYLVDAFGNSTRIDYGTGHEISFVMFLCCLFKIGFLKDCDKTATGCKIFPRYLDVARKLQQTYRMEPAGSHGVWSLDDYQFVPFIWGSSQLFAHPKIEPSAFLQPNILNEFGNDYMFLTCIRYINEVKTGPFAEHSNQLWSISGVPSWSKINGGLIKMYKAEVLSKFPVVQHIVFGSLFTLKAVEQSTGLMSAKTSMIPPPVPFPKEARGSAVEKDSTARSLKKTESSGVVHEQSTGAASTTTSETSSLSGKKQASEISVPSGGKEPSRTSIPSGEKGLSRTSAQSSESVPSNQKSIESDGQKSTNTESVGKASSTTSVHSHESTKTPSQGDQQGSVVISSDVHNAEIQSNENAPQTGEKTPNKVSISSPVQSEEKKTSVRTSVKIEGKGPSPK